LWDLSYWSSGHLCWHITLWCTLRKTYAKTLLECCFKLLGRQRTPSARVDLEEMGVRSNLHKVATEDDESCTMPEASYVH
jgi:hypothetical protein